MSAPVGHGHKKYKCESTSDCSCFERDDWLACLEHTFDTEAQFQFVFLSSLSQVQLRVLWVHQPPNNMNNVAFPTFVPPPSPLFFHWRKLGWELKKLNCYWRTFCFSQSLQKLLRLNILQSILVVVVESTLVNFEASPSKVNSLWSRSLPKSKIPIQFCTNAEVLSFEPNSLAKLF